MSLLPCALLFVCVPFVCASLPSLNDTCIHTLDSIDSLSNNNTRTLWDILLSCGLTLFACTWTAIHTNIPGMDEGRVAITSRRLFLMVVALIAPELIITWVTRQFFSAQRAKKDFNNAFGLQLPQDHDDNQAISEKMMKWPGETIDPTGSPTSSAPKPAEFREWTVTHGFFAWMGGFMLYVNGKPRATLTPDELRHFVREGSVDMPLISEAEIEDRSKGDGLSKAISLFQLGWFVVQLVARYVQNLPITLLEIDTLAIAALTCVAYGLWWKKPKDVGCPWIVHWKGKESPTLLTYDNADTNHLPLYHIYPFLSLMGIKAYISPSAARYRRVPSLGSYGEYNAKIVLLIGCFSGMMFGGIHCLGWNYLFQGNAEHMLWRAASLGIACAPVFLFLAIGCVMHVNNVGGFGAVVVMSATFISSFMYIVARVTVIVLMMLSLRSLPLGAYNTVAWTTFIPHFNT